MAEFKVDEFANDPDIDVLDKLNIDQLITLGKHLEFSLKITQRKNESFPIIYQKYVDNWIF